MKIYNINIFYIVFLILIILPFVVYIINNAANSYFTKNNPIWNDNLNNTTWRFDNGWAGENYVFYTDNKGNKKCIHQIEGSGLYVVGSSFPEFKIIGANKFKIGEDIYEYKDNKLISKDKVLTFSENKPIVGYRLGYVDINLIKNTKSIEELNFLTSNGPGFQVYLVDKHEEDYTQTYEFNESHRNNFLEKSKLGNLIFTDKDIEKYNWTTQTITLNKKIPKLKEGEYFLVILNGKRLYGGMITSPFSAMGIFYPVIFNEYKSDNIEIRPYVEYRYENINKNLGKNIEFPEIKDYFISQNKLSENYIGNMLEVSGDYGVVDNIFLPSFEKNGYKKYLNKKVEISGILSIERGCGEDNIDGKYINCFKGERKVIKNSIIKLVPDYEFKYSNSLDKEFEEKEKKILELGKKAIIQKFGQEAFEAQKPLKAVLENNPYSSTIVTNTYVYGTKYEIINGKNTKMGYSERGGGNLTVEFTKDLKVSKVYYSR